MRDAVHAVRVLGLEWLWIDSLCIVQDSAEDWKREAGMMAGVYIGAEVTVAATGCGAEGDGGGMFTGGREEEKVGRGHLSEEGNRALRVVERGWGGSWGE